MKKTSLTLAAIFVFAAFISSCKTSSTATAKSAASSTAIPSGASPTAAYFTASVLPILQNKCNGCHSNKGGHAPVFTEAHMANAHVKGEVNETVFEQGTMPAGNVKLTADEMAVLKYWVKNEFK